MQAHTRTDAPRLRACAFGPLLFSFSREEKGMFHNVDDVVFTAVNHVIFFIVFTVSSKVDTRTKMQSEKELVVVVNVTTTDTNM